MELLPGLQFKFFEPGLYLHILFAESHEQPQATLEQSISAGKLLLETPQTTKKAVI